MYNNTFPSSCSTSAPTVPFDMCLEILTRVSLRTLAVCKQVCKDWFKLVHESYFTNFYHQRSGVVSGYYIQSIERCHVHSTFVTMHTPLLPKGSSACLNLQFLPIRDPTILASSRQGLLCCVSEEKIPKYYVCKPATKEWRQIPNPKTKYFTDNIAMLVLRSNPAHFMIVRFSEPKYPCIFKQGELQNFLRTEIYNSKYDKWRRSEDIILPGYMCIRRGHSIFFNGAFHWLTSEDKMFAFNVENEKGKLIPLPQVSTRCQIRHQLVLSQDRLTLLTMGEKWMELWIVQDYHKTEWCKMQSVNIDTLHLGRHLDLYASDVVFEQVVFGALWYNFKDRSCTKLHVPEHMIPTHIFPFQSDSEYCYLSDLG